MSVKVGEATVQHLLLLFPCSGFHPLYVLKSCWDWGCFQKRRCWVTLCPGEVLGVAYSSQKPWNCFLPSLCWLEWYVWPGLWEQVVPGLWPLCGTRFVICRWGELEI